MNATIETKYDVLESMEELQEYRAQMEAELLEEVKTRTNPWSQNVDHLLQEPSGVTRTLRECYDLADRFILDGQWQNAAKEESRKDLLNRLKTHSLALYKTVRVYAAVEFDHKMEKARDLWRIFDEHENTIRWERSLTFQSGLEFIMRSCGDEEERHEFWHSFLAVNGSKIEPRRVLNPSRDPPPAPVPASRLAFKNAASHLPAEILAMIYATADLETCVEMRQVCSAWYHMFQELDLRPRLKARNPWMEPQDDFSSWKDCVLVFVARLRTWKTAPSVDRIHVPAKPEQRRALVAISMQADEKLPSNFSGMADDSADGFASDFVRLPGDPMDPIRVRDQRTLETRELDVYPEVLAEYEDETVVQCGDLQVSLPPSIESQDISLDRPVVLTESFVCLCLESRDWYALPRDAPHFANGMQFINTGQPPIEIGGVLVNYESLPDTEQIRFELADFETKQMVDYALFHDGEYSPPVASYNGIIWWNLGQGPWFSVVPTFKDLASPDRVYYLPRTAITCLTSPEFQQGSRARDSAQFLLSHPLWTDTEYRMQVIDLAKTVITNVNSPIDTAPRNVKTFVGFISDTDRSGTHRTFQARVLDTAA